MKLGRLLKHEFLEFIADQLKEDTIYVSIPYATLVHKCCCGCGTEVVTPLGPTDWTLFSTAVDLSRPLDWELEF